MTNKSTIRTSMPGMPAETDDQKEKVAKLSAVWLALQERWRPWRIRCIRNYEYVIGNQLSAEQRKILNEEHRPATVFNLIMPLIVYIGGTLSMNRTVLKAVPKRAGDEDATELHNVLVSDWWMANCNGYIEAAKAAMDAAICGLGYINNYVDFGEDVEGKGITEAADPLTIMPDPDAPIAKQDKWRYYSISAYYSADEIISMFNKHLTPEMKEKIKQRAKELEANYQDIGKPQGWLTRVWNGTMDWLGIKSTEEGNQYKTDFIDSANGLYRVVEFHDRRVIHKKIFYDPVSRQSFDVPELANTDADTQSVNLEAPKPADPAAQLKAQYPGGHVVETTTKEYWRTAAAPGLLPENVLFEQPYEKHNKGWQHKIITGYDFHWDSTKVVALIDPLIDPQDSYNQRRMTMLNALMEMVDPPIEAKKNSIDDENIAEWQSKERGLIKFYNGDKAPEHKYPPAGIITLLNEFSQEDRDLVQKLSGITPNMEGRKESANEPAILFNSRVNQGRIMQALFMSHLIQALTMTYTYVDGLIQTYMTSERAVRILSEPTDEMQATPGFIGSKKDIGAYWLQVNYKTLDGVLNDVKEGEYDFTPDTTQLDQTQRMIKFSEMMEFIKTVPPEFINWPEAFNAWDSPYSGKMKAFAEQIMSMKLGQMQAQNAVTQSAGKTQLMTNAAQQAAIAEHVQSRVAAV